MEWLIPLLMMSSVSRERRGAAVEQLLPLALPGPAVNRIALAAITTERLLQRQAQAEQQMLEEAVQAGKIADAAALGQFPALSAAFTRLPAAAQAKLFQTGKTAGRAT